jgi:hypothetical protein
VNYSNRNASVGVSNEQLFTAYIAEVLLLPLAAIRLFQVAPLFPVYKIIIIVASHYYSFNDLFFVELLTIKGGLVGRLVPLVAVAAANCVNIPLMRQQELKNGIAIETKDGMKAPATVLLTGMCLTFSTPLCCALFPQKRMNNWYQDLLY